MAHLPSAENRYPAYQGVPVAERVIVMHAADGDVDAYLASAPQGRLLKRPTKVSKKAVAAVRVEHGRWLADCPWCKAAVFAPLTDPRFFCPECMNTPVAGEFVRLQMPDEQTREQIVELLVKVPDESCRNWLSHETVAELARQVHEFNGGAR